LATGLTTNQMQLEQTAAALERRFASSSGPLVAKDVSVIREADRVRLPAASPLRIATAPETMP